MDILDWVKVNAKEGADINEAEKLVDDLNPLKNVKSKNEALDFIMRNDVFKSALDSETSTRIDRHDKRFKEEKLPSLIEAERDKLRREMNPTLTPEQERIARLEEDLKRRDQRDVQNSLKDKLRQRAVELEYDPIRAEKLYLYGESAITELENEVEFFKTKLNTSMENKLKGQYTKDPLKKTENEPGKAVDRSSFDSMSISEKSSFIKSGGKVIE